jgi:HSP20 family protein
MVLQDRMNRLFEDATERRAKAADSDELEAADWYPTADVYDTEAAYVEIDLDDEKLVIHGSRVIEAAGANGKKPTVRPQGRFRRSFAVPANITQEGIKAEYRNGVLEVTLPKRSEPRTQRVQIKVQ